jgi:hypothetical protein
MALAKTSADVASLQTIASLENLAATTYRRMAKRPELEQLRDRPKLKRFFVKVQAQHVEQAGSLNAILRALGAAEQKGSDTTVAGDIKAGEDKATGVGELVRILVQLELEVAATYALAASRVTGTEARLLVSSVAPVRAQYVAVLRILQASIDTPTLDSVFGSGDATSASPQAVEQAIPESFFSIGTARPLDEGKVGHA